MQPKEIKVKLFPAGKQIEYKGQTYIVDHVRIKEDKVFVKFNELDTYIDSDDIHCEYTTFKF